MIFPLLFAGFALGLLVGMAICAFLGWLDSGYAKELIEGYESCIRENCELQRENKRLKFEGEQGVGPESIHYEEPDPTADPDWWKHK